MRGFGEYDKEQLQKAKELIIKVYEYNYGDPEIRNEIKRLNTIISKLEIIISKIETSLNK